MPRGIITVLFEKVSSVSLAVLRLAVEVQRSSCLHLLSAGLLLLNPGLFTSWASTVPLSYTSGPEDCFWMIERIRVVPGEVVRTAAPLRAAAVFFMCLEAARAWVHR